jgi:hypothetical protein
MPEDNQEIKPTLPSPTEMRRLAVIRYLHGQGIEHSRGPEPVAGLAILSLHDAAEMFLQILCEHYDVGENKADFMRYWELLATKGIVVTQREAMRRLNAARRVLKHQGVLPAHVELEGFRAATTNLLYENSRAFLGVDFDSVSLVDLIVNDEIRYALHETEKDIQSENYIDAMGNLAIIFTSILDQHSDRPIPTARRGGRPFRLERDDFTVNRKGIPKTRRI